MTNPFTFNPALVKREPYTDTHGRRWIRVSYAQPMPDGGKIGSLIAPNNEQADRMAQRQLEATFRHHVDGLSAHARLAWAASAMTEVAP